jgi:hypothetical protein
MKRRERRRCPLFSFAACGRRRRGDLGVFSAIAVRRSISAEFREIVPIGVPDRQLCSAWCRVRRLDAGAHAPAREAG